MHWFDSRLLRSARPFVPSGLPSSFSRSPSDHQIGGGGAESATEDDQAMVAMMCDLVLGEIQAEIDRAERETERRRQEELRLANQPDYSWLMDWRLRSKRSLGFRESSEVELLCAKVRPGEWRRLLKEWRIRVRFAENRDEILSTFRVVVEEQVGERMQRECHLVVEEDEHGHGAQSLGNMIAGEHWGISCRTQSPAETASEDGALSAHSLPGCPTTFRVLTDTPNGAGRELLKGRGGRARKMAGRLRGISRRMVDRARGRMAGGGRGYTRFQ